MENIVESRLTLAGLSKLPNEKNEPLKGNPSDNGVFYKEVNASKLQQF